MKNERFNLVIKVKKFIFDINELIINYPKRDYDIKDRLKYSCYELLRLIYRANYSKDKYEYQMDILTNISMIDFCLEESLNKQIISIKRLKYITNNLNEITEMVYGWLDDSKVK